MPFSAVKLYILLTSMTLKWIEGMRVRFGVLSRTTLLISLNPHFILPKKTTTHDYQWVGLGECVGVSSYEITVFSFKPAIHIFFTTGSVCSQVNTAIGEPISNEMTN